MRHNCKILTCNVLVLPPNPDTTITYSHATIMYSLPMHLSLLFVPPHQRTPTTKILLISFPYTLPVSCEQVTVKYQLFGNATFNVLELFPKTIIQQSCTLYTCTSLYYYFVTPHQHKDHTYQSPHTNLCNIFPIHPLPVSCEQVIAKY